MFEIEVAGAGRVLTARRAGFRRIRDRDYDIHLEVESLERALEALATRVADRMAAD